MNNSLVKAAALLVCFGFLLMTVPGLNAVEKKAVKLNLKPAVIQTLTSLFPWLAALLGGKAKSKAPAYSYSGGIVKPTGDAPIGKPGSGD